MGYRFNNTFLQKALTTLGFMWQPNLMRNLLVRGLNVANFNFCLLEFAPSFFLPTITWGLC